MQSLLDPAILFFVFGVLAGALKSNLEIPPAISRFLSLYLLMALGLAGSALANEGGPAQHRAHATDRLAAVADFLQARVAGHDLGADGGRHFGSRIVVGDDDVDGRRDISAEMRMFVSSRTSITLGRAPQR